MLYNSLLLLPDGLFSRWMQARSSMQTRVTVKRAGQPLLAVGAHAPRQQAKSTYRFISCVQ